MPPKREKLARLDKDAVDRRCGDTKINDLILLELRIRITKRPAQQRGMLRTHYGQVAILLLIRKILARSEIGDLPEESLLRNSSVINDGMNFR